MEPMKILLVDDSKSARYALRLQLQRHGIEVDTADSAESAFEYLKDALPDAIMMDHMMPGLNGFEALEVIRKDPRTAHIPIVMCTSHEDPDFAATARGKGVVGILPKSTAPEKLPAILDLLSEAVTSVAAAAPTPAPAPTPVPAPAAPAAPVVEGVTEARALELVDARLDSQLASRIDERLDVRITAVLAPMLEELRRELTERLTAEAGHLIDERVGALEQSLASAPAAVDADEVRASAERYVAGQLPTIVTNEVQTAVSRVAQSTLPDLVKTETERTTDRLRSETLPQLVRAEISDAVDSVARTSLPDLIKIEIEAERGQVMDLVDQYLGELKPSASQGAAISDEALAEIEGKIANKLQDTARRETREGIESAVESATKAAEEVASKARSGLGAVYAAIAGAAGVGVAAAAVVYLLLQ